ncbi:MAG: hypothetical protein CVU61_00550 [Deltaproteobacteria bacterium HGW-Deltaproteobacteria-19]|nr:MAG: hypothetical protein CVU61_00550 [Deltaproteobacteria bacterium HGW-Deltaproteobacteria-19]
MKRMLWIFLAILVVAGTVYAKDYEITKKAGPYQVVAAIDRNPPITGKNQLTIALRDAAGKAVMDAKVDVDYGMPAMPGMPAMSYKTGTTLKGDRFTATMNFSMGGSWNITVKINRGGKTETVRFTVDVR